jgi:hypothetical protein
MKYFALPTWALTGVLRPILPAKHTFKKHISLTDWAKNRTDTCMVFDLFFWMQIPISIFLVRAVL